MKKQYSDENQLSLFEVSTPEATTKIEKEPNPFDLIRARFEKEPPKSPEEYKRWIKFLINSSLKNIR